MSSSLDPDYAQNFVKPDLGLNCLQNLSAGNIYIMVFVVRNLILLHTNDKGTDSTVPLHSLISAFVMHFVENKIANLGTVKISNFQQLSVARRWDWVLLIPNPSTFLFVINLSIVFMYT